MFASLGLHVKSLFLHHKKYLLSQLASYTVIAFVAITAVRITWLYSVEGNFDYTNVYRLNISENADRTKLVEAINTYIESSNEFDTVHVYAPDKNEPRVIVGLNRIVDVDWSWEKLDSALIKSDENYAWMGSNYWLYADGIRFPYEEITINDTIYTVAGVMDICLFAKGKDIDRYSNRGIYLPLQNFLKSDYPIDRVAIRLYNPSDNEKFNQVCSLFSPFVDEPIERPPSPRLSGFGTLMSFVLLPMVLSCVLLLGVQTLSVCKQRGILIWAESAAGAPRRTIFLEFFIQTSVMFLIGCAISLYPSNIVYRFGHYNGALPTLFWVITYAALIGISLITQGIAIFSAVRSTLNRREMMNA